MLGDGLDDDDLELVAGIAEELEFYKNDVIFRENEVEDSIFIITEGKISIERHVLPNLQISHTHINIVKRGQILGEMGFIEKRSRSATAIAKSHVRVLRLNFQQLEDLINNNQKLGLNLYRTLASLVSRRLRRMTDQWIRTVESSSLKEFDYF